MHSDLYGKFVESVNATEVYPPFAEIRELVLRRGSRRVPLFYRYAAAAIVGAALMGLGSHLISNGAAITSARPVARTAATTDFSMASARMNALPMIRGIYGKTFAAAAPTTIVPVEETIQNVAPVADPQVALVPSSRPSTPLSSLPLPATNVTGEHWSGFVAIDPAMYSVNAASFNQLFGAAGAIYSLTGNASLVFEARRTYFEAVRNGQSGGLRDTTLNAGGQTYRSTIGTSAEGSALASWSVSSLDAGCRYVWFPDAALSPSAELIAGASTAGFFASGAVGLDYRLNALIGLSLSARDAEVYSAGGSPLRSLSVEAGMECGW